MSQIKMVKYTYRKPNTFEMIDESGQLCWVEFMERVENNTNPNFILYNWKPIQIEQGN